MSEEQQRDARVMRHVPPTLSDVRRRGEEILRRYFPHAAHAVVDWSGVWSRDHRLSEGLHAAAWDAWNAMPDRGGIEPPPKPPTGIERTAQGFRLSRDYCRSVLEWAAKVRAQRAEARAAVNPQRLKEAKLSGGKTDARVTPARPSLNDTDERAMKFIRENPGCKGEAVAAGISVTPEHFRSRVVPKLKKAGFTNNGNGSGYRPPPPDKVRVAR